MSIVEKELVMLAESVKASLCAIYTKLEHDKGIFKRVIGVDISEVKSEHLYGKDEPVSTYVDVEFSSLLSGCDLDVRLTAVDGGVSVTSYVNKFKLEQTSLDSISEIYVSKEEGDFNQVFFPFMSANEVIDHLQHCVNSYMTGNVFQV